MFGNRRFKKLNRPQLEEPTAGLTLIECLVAIAVIAVIGASIAPVMVISVASRIQSQRANQALQVAQGEIDRVRQVVDQGILDDGLGGARDYTNADLEIASTTLAITAAAAPNGVVPQYTQAGADAYQKARSVDVDRDGDLDFAVQAYRTVGRADASGRPVVFDMGVRVYDYDAVINNPAALETVPSRLGPTAGSRTGAASGSDERSRRPLAVLYTEIIKSDETQSLCEYYLTQSTSTTGLDCS